jgi:imidazolonepropionase-like amidohydrolase
MSDRIKIFNGQIIHQNRIQSGGCLLIENGKVVDVPTNDIDFPDAKLVDASVN